jgi:hypothetical protein
MAFEPIVGTPVRFPPGHVAVRLDARYRLPYRRLYRRYQTQLAGLPVLRDRDFDGRAVKMRPGELEALNAALARVLGGSANGAALGPFGAQERVRTGLFKRLQYLS